MKDKDKKMASGVRDERLEFAYAIMTEKALDEILNAFETENIPVSPLKGAFLRHLLYEDPTGRLMTDLDILVRKRDYQRAKSALEKLGMLEDRSSDIINHPRAYSHCHYYRNGFPLVELHQAVAPLAYETAFEELIFSGRAGIYPADIFPQKCVHLPPPEVQLLILALHFREHYLSVEKHQIEDVGRLCRRFNIDKSKLAEIAARFKCEFALWLLLESSGSEKALETAEALKPPFIRKLVHMQLFDAVDGGFSLKHSKDAPRMLTLMARGFIHGVYSRDSLMESAAAHMKMLLFMLKNRIG